MDRKGFVGYLAVSAASLWWGVKEGVAHHKPNHGKGNSTLPPCTPNDKLYPGPYQQCGS